MVYFEWKRNKNKKIQPLNTEKEDLELLSNKDITNLILEESKKPINTAELFKKIISLLELPDSIFETKIGDYYTDEGISAKKGNYRPEFERLKEDIKNKKINTMLALKQDRITRSIFDWENIITFLEENNAYLDLVNDDINTTTSNGRMVSRIMMSVSQNEIERTSERTKV